MLSICSFAFVLAFAKLFLLASANIPSRIPFVCSKAFPSEPSEFSGSSIPWLSTRFLNASFSFSDKYFKASIAFFTSRFLVSIPFSFLEFLPIASLTTSLIASWVFLLLFNFSLKISFSFFERYVNWSMVAAAFCLAASACCSSSVVFFLNKCSFGIVTPVLVLFPFKILRYSNFVSRLPSGFFTGLNFGINFLPIKLFETSFLTLLITPFESVTIPLISLNFSIPLRASSISILSKSATGYGDL